MADPAIVVALVMMTMGAKTQQNSDCRQGEEGHDESQSLVMRRMHTTTAF